MSGAITSKKLKLQLIKLNKRRKVNKVLKTSIQPTILKSLSHISSISKVQPSQSIPKAQQTQSIPKAQPSQSKAQMQTTLTVSTLMGNSVIPEINKSEIKSTLNIKQDQEYIIVTCPHCGDLIQIYKKELNCRIFRHGVYKKNNQQIPPHLDKLKCDRLASQQLIHGCGKPFRIIRDSNGQENIQICDYI